MVQLHWGGGTPTFLSRGEMEELVGLIDAHLERLPDAEMSIEVDPRRVEAGQKQGFETSKNGLTLAGPRYYERFREACTGMIRDYGVNYFKFDGFGGGNDKDGAGPFASDVEALLRLRQAACHPGLVDQHRVQPA